MAARPQSLHVDISVAWMGNKLVGKRGVFVDPNTPNWAQNLGNMQALGVWPEVASAVCGQIQRLAALKGRPMVNSVQILVHSPQTTSCPSSTGRPFACFSRMPEDATF